MCRSIKQLRPPVVLSAAAQPAAPATDEEIRAAALQYVRKVSGYRVPSRANRAAFDQAVEEIAAATRALLESLS